MTEETKHIEYIDVLRVLSMVFVVFLHTAAGSLRGNLGSPVWHFSNIITAVMSTSVPIFFMISGAVLLSNAKTLSVSYTLKKRLTKVLIPFIVWSLVAVAYYAALSYKANGAVDIGAALKRLINMPGQPTTVHLWFMYALIPLYILSPILKRLVDSMDRKLVFYVLALWIIFGSILPTIAAFMPEAYRPLFVLNGSYNLNFMTGYAGYFIAGYYLMEYKGNVSKEFIAAIILADTVIISIGTWWKTSGAAVYSEMFKSYSKLFMLILSVAIFLLFKEMLKGRRLPGLASRLVQFMSGLSFGIYLLHNLLVDLISRIVGLWPAVSVSMLLLCWLAVLFASAFCIFILASLKPFCYAFTGLKYESACKTCNFSFLIQRSHK